MSDKGAPPLSFGVGQESAESWLPVVGYPDLYEVSSLGRVRRIGRRVLRPGLSRGYPTIGLCRDGLVRSASVHSLVAAAFIGPRPDGHAVDHVDGDRTNNRADNLEYVTPLENTRRALARAEIRPRQAKSFAPKKSDFEPVSAEEKAALRAQGRAERAARLPSTSEASS